MGDELKTVSLKCKYRDGKGVTEAHVFARHADGSNSSGYRSFPCHDCGGLGTITAEHAERLCAGRAMAEDRKRRRLTLREEARRLNLSPVQLSDLEWGRA